MEDYKSMFTSTITNLRKLNALDDELVDPTLYTQMIGSLMYPVNNRLDMCFTMNTLSQFMVELRRVHWVAAKQVLKYLRVMISWYSKKQHSVALGSAKAEYMATSLARCEAIWLHKMLTGLFRLEMGLTVIDCDHQSCIKLSENQVFHYRSKHTEIIYHFIKGKVQRGVVRLQYISTRNK
eukprot:PITA_13840